MKMKKMIALIAAATMVFSMAACGSSGSTDDAGSAGTETDSGAAESTDSDDNVLVMATNAEFPPYESEENGEYVGIDVDIAQAIADDLGMTLEIENMAFNSVITAVQTGKADIGMAGMTVTEDRKENVNFTDPYSTGVQVIIVKEDSAIASVDDLSADIKIGVQEGTTAQLLCRNDYGDDAVEAYENGAVAVEALKSDTVDCVIIDSEPAASYVAENEGLKILDTKYADENYAIAIAKDNDELLEKVNASLTKLIEDGTVQSIIDKYTSAE